MLKGILIILLTLCIARVEAQQKKDTIKFAGFVSAGLLTGESQKIFAYELIGGIRFKKWFTGLGASYDQYGYRSIPVFVDARRYFGNRSWHPFVYGDAGVNLALYSNELPRKRADVDYVKFSPTFFGEAGIGIDTRVSKKTKLYFSSGFSYKQFSYLQYNTGFWGQGNTQDNSRRYDYYYRRICFRMGLQF